jgi:serine/threonine protein kinase
MNDDDSTAIEALLIETETAILAGTPLPSPVDAELSSVELGEFREMQDCLILLHNARRGGWLDKSGDDIIAKPDLLRLESPAVPEETLSIGRFEIIRELGRGGHGVVFLARDPRLRRLVALKVARPECLISDDLRKRFHREAMAAGGLHHGNIIDVYEVGEAGPVSYIASAYCEGPTLHQWLAGAGRQASNREAATLVAAVARAVEHAHSKGVLHRDIKPSNVLLEPAASSGRYNERDALRTMETLGRYIPKLGDFGLAKLLDSTDDQTRTGSTLGTPAYMAPEQASGRIDLIGPSTDVYALGVLLYELLVGHPPLRGDNDIDTARRVCEDEPIPPRRLRPTVSPDLEAICLHCLEKTPSQRYPTAAALVEDLSRFLAGEPTIVRPLRRAQVALRWIKRRPLQSALLAVSVASIVSLSGGGWWASVRSTQALHRESVLRSEAEASKLEAVASSAQTKRLLYASDMRVAYQLYLNGNLKASQELLHSHIPGPGDEDLREFSWNYINYRTQPELTTFRGHPEGLRTAVISGDGTHLITVGNDGQAKLWNVASREVLLATSPSSVDVTAFSNDGLRFAVADSNTAFIYSLDDLEHPRKFLHKVGQPASLAFSEPQVSLEEEMLAISGASKRVELWRVSDTRACLTSMQIEDAVSAVAFSSHGELAIAHGKSVGSYRTSGDFGLVSSLETDAEIRCIEYSNARCGKIAIGLSDGRTLVRSTAAAADEIEVRHAQSVNAVAFHASGQFVATASSDGMARVWDAKTGRCLKEFVGHTDRVVNAAFCQNGSRLMTASDDGSAKICRIEDASFTVVDWPNFGVNELGFSNDSRLFVWTGHPTSGGVPGCTGLVELPSFGADFVQGAAGSYADLQFLKEHRRFITTDNAGNRCDVRVTSTPVTSKSYLEPANQPGFAPKLSATSNGEMVVWGDVYPLYVTYVDGGKAERIGSDESGEVTELRINPFSEDYVLVASAQVLMRWDLRTRECTHRWVMPTSVKGFDYVDKDRVALAGADGVLRIVDLSSGEETTSFPSNDGPIRSVAVHPNGRTLALGHAGGAISLWDLSVNRQLLTFAGHKSEVTSVRFSPDGQYLASGGAPGQVFIWSALHMPAESLTPSQVKQTASSVGLTAKVVVPANVSVRVQRLPTTVPFDQADLPEKFRRVYDYAKSVGYSGAFPTCIDEETDDGIAIGVVAFKPGVCRWGEALESEVTSTLNGKAGVDGLLMRHWRSALWGERYKQALVFSNFHQGMSLDRLVWGVIEIDAAAYVLDRADAVVPAEADSLSNRLRMLNTEAFRRGYHGALPTCDDDTDGHWIGAAFFKPESAEVLEVPAHLLSN